MKKRRKVAIALSGGVDSAVSAALLKKEGYDLVGVFMHCYPQTGWPCTEDLDRADALKIAQKLDIPFRVFDFEKGYKEKVLDYFYKEYKEGRTPNPDSHCNREIKFGLFLDKATKELGVDFIATGHYVRKLESRIMNHESRYKLLRGVDPKKDQSYFLYMISQGQLARSLFPVGGFLKSDVRRMAKDFGFHNFEKRGTRGICFIGKVDLKDFLNKEIEKKRGEVVDAFGNVIGEHEGVWFYTIGQRHGFSIDQGKVKKTENAVFSGLPVYVISKDAEKNRLVVGWGRETEKDSFTVSGVHWIDPGGCFPFGRDSSLTSRVRSGQALGMTGKGVAGLACQVRIRHLGELYKCRIMNYESRITNRLSVELEQGVRGVASGQDAVFYDGDEVLGGGMIE